MSNGISDPLADLRTALQAAQTSLQQAVTTETTTISSVETALADVQAAIAAANDKAQALTTDDVKDKALLQELQSELDAVSATLAKLPPPTPARA